MTPADDRPVARRGLAVGRLAGLALLVSIPFWWTGLRGWAEAQLGYLEIEAIGMTPFLWVLLVGMAGLILVTGLLPHRSLPGLNVAAALVALMAAGVLAWVNLAHGAGDGISPAGWAIAGLSVAQVALFLVGMLSGHRRAPSVTVGEVQDSR